MLSTSTEIEYFVEVYETRHVSKGDKLTRNFK
jgi:hypothetical protein